MNTAHKTKLINVRVTDEEKKLLEIGARQKHLSLSAFIIQTSLNEVEAVMKGVLRKTETEDALSRDELKGDEKTQGIADAMGVDVISLRHRGKHKADDAIRDFIAWSERNGEDLEREFGPIPQDEEGFSAYMQKVKVSRRCYSRRKSASF